MGLVKDCSSCYRNIGNIDDKLCTGCSMLNGWKNYTPIRYITTSAGTEEFKSRFGKLPKQEENKEKYLTLRKGTEEDNIYFISNKQGEKLGYITKHRFGRFLHWAFFPYRGFYISASCLEEIREMIRNPIKYIEKG